MTPLPGRTVHQLTVTLLDTAPPVWRRVLVDSGCTLDHLHEVIQAAFGWWNHHLHEFEIGTRRYGVPHPYEDWGPPPRDERRARLGDIAPPGRSLLYVYDFGDHWRHRVTVERILPADAAPPVPALIDGRRAAPPEDCGGTGGFDDFLQIMADPTHPEHEEMREWLGRPYDPAAVDIEGFAANLRLVRSGVLDDIG